MVGYNVRCKLCNCEHRAKSEKLHEDGASLQQVVDFLSGHDVSISKASVRRHFDTHFAPREEAAKRYHEQSAEVMNDAVEKRLTDLQMLDATIKRNYRLHVLATDSVEESLTTEHPVMLKNGKPLLDPDNDYKPVTRKFPPPKPIVDLVSGTGAEIRQALKLKAELVGDKQPDGSVSIDLSGLTLEELKALAAIDGGEEEDSS